MQGVTDEPNAWHNLHSYDRNQLAHGRLRQVHAFVIFHESAWDTGLIIARGIDGGSAVASSEYLSGLFFDKET